MTQQPTRSAMDELCEEVNSRLRLTATDNPLKTSAAVMGEVLLEWDKSQPEKAQAAIRQLWEHGMKARQGSQP
jgi:hypothetical protein